MRHKSTGKHTAAPRAEEDPAQVLHPEACLPRRRAHPSGRRSRARGAREAGLPVTVRRCGEGLGVEYDAVHKLTLELRHISAKFPRGREGSEAGR